jgi:DNA segregation ATPase FtsK/SpoIIIE-like protein
MGHEEIITLLKEIQANQQSLHDDMASIVDRLTNTEAVITQLVQQSDQPSAIDEHQLYTAACSLVVETGRASTSMLQRVLRIGYSRAAFLIDTLEARGVIGPSNGFTPRTVLLDQDTLDQMGEEEESGPMPTGDSDELYEDAKRAVIEAGKSSTAYLQRKLRIGYSRAVFIQNLLEKNGVVGPQDGVKPRVVYNK